MKHKNLLFSISSSSYYDVLFTLCTIWNIYQIGWVSDQPSMVKDALLSKSKISQIVQNVNNMIVWTGRIRK